MKILHIICNLSMGGGQNLLISLAGHQQKNGNEVTVLQLRKSNDDTVSSKIISKGVEVKWLKEKGNIYSPTFIFAIIPYLDRRKYDIVHVHLFPTLYWVGFARLFARTPPPIVYTEHSTYNKRRKNFILRNIDKIIYKNCYQRIIACADKALDAFLAVYPNIKHACTVNNGVDTLVCTSAKPYTKQELLGISEDSFVFTMVASFLPMKRQDVLVEALCKLPDSFHAVFVGGTEADLGLQKVKKMVQSLGLEKRVHFLYIRSDVPRILKTSDVVVMASEYEGLSLSSIEGMAAGKPFLASNVNGLREVVEEAGFLFDLNNSDELADLLLKLYSDKDLYAETVKRCEKRAQEYNVDNMVGKYMDIYREVMN